MRSRLGAMAANDSTQHRPKRVQQMLLNTPLNLKPNQRCVDWLKTRNGVDCLGFAFVEFLI